MQHYRDRLEHHEMKNRVAAMLRRSELYDPGDAPETAGATVAIEILRHQGVKSDDIAVAMARVLTGMTPGDGEGG